MASVTNVQCVDFLQFQEILKKMRLLDDTIIYSLNTQLPTESFSAQRDCASACKELFGKLDNNYKDRENVLKQCLDYSSSKVAELKAKKDGGENDSSLLKELRKEQTKLRLLRTEQGVEEVIRERTKRVFYERCRSYYVPVNLSNPT